jgi:hypothetical protein
MLGFEVLAPQFGHQAERLMTSGSSDVQVKSGKLGFSAPPGV